MPADTQDANRGAFADYLAAMPESLGKRFLQVHLRDYGVEGLDRFWLKLCKARALEIDTVDLSPEERHSLATVIEEQMSRRSFMARSAALFVGAVGGLLLLKTAQDRQNGSISSIMDDREKISPQTAAIVIGGAAAAVGAYAILKQKAVRDMSARDIIESRDEQTFATFIDDINGCFHRLQMAVDETKPFPRQTSPSRK